MEKSQNRKRIEQCLNEAYFAVLGSQININGKLLATEEEVEQALIDLYYELNGRYYYGDY